MKFMKYSLVILLLLCPLLNSWANGKEVVYSCPSVGSIIHLRNSVFPLYSGESPPQSIPDTGRYYGYLYSDKDHERIAIKSPLYLWDDIQEISQETLQFSEIILFKGLVRCNYTVEHAIHPDMNPVTLATYINALDNGACKKEKNNTISCAYSTVSHAH